MLSVGPGVGGQRWAELKGKAKKKTTTAKKEEREKEMAEWEKFLANSLL